MTTSNLIDNTNIISKINNVGHSTDNYDREQADHTTVNSLGPPSVSAGRVEFNECLAINNRVR